MSTAIIIKQDHANFSPCGQYRYTLSRAPAGPYSAPALICGLLNPSVADAHTNDPTVRRMIGFTTLWERAGFVIWNPYALRSTDSSVLWRHRDPVGPQNDWWLQQLLSKPGVTDFLCAWGRECRPDRIKQVVKMLNDFNIRPVCLGVNNDGSPIHPLYLKSTTQLRPWKPNV